MSGNPTLDLFASSINHQIDRYISWKPDPKVIAIDAFSLYWNTEFYHIFTTFSVLGKVKANFYKTKRKPLWWSQNIPLSTGIPAYQEKQRETWHDTITKKFRTTMGSTKSLSTTPKASPGSAIDQLTTQDIINPSSLLSQQSKNRAHNL